MGPTPTQGKREPRWPGRWEVVLEGVENGAEPPWEEAALGKSLPVPPFRAESSFLGRSAPTTHQVRKKASLTVCIVL